MKRNQVKIISRNRPVAGLQLKTKPLYPGLRQV